MNLRDEYIHGQDQKGVVKSAYFATAASGSIAKNDLVLVLADKSGTQIPLTVPTLNQNTSGYATKTIVRQNTSSDGNYPLVWSAQSNTSDQTADQLRKSHANLTYNPKQQILKSNIFQTGNNQLTTTGLYLQSPNVVWNDGTWWQRILVTDDSIANTVVFSFQQSSNSGSSYTDLFKIYDNGNVYSAGYHHTSHNNNDSVLLAGGGYKAITDFKIGNYLPLSGGTMTGTITAYVGNQTGIKLGDAYLTAIGSQMILQGGTLRFGSSAWNWDTWAGLKYDSDSKTIYLGTPEGTVFNNNGTAISDGTFTLAGIAKTNIPGALAVGGNTTIGGTLGVTGTITGNLTGDVTGNVTGSAGSIKGYTFKTLSGKNHSGWTNGTTDDKIIPTMSFIAHWNGAYDSSGHSNLSYCNQGAFGTAATHAHGDYVTSIGVSGKTLTWAKGGAAQTALTIPYATSAGDSDTVDGKHWSDIEKAINAGFAANDAMIYKGTFTGQTSSTTTLATTTANNTTTINGFSAQPSTTSLGWTWKVSKAGYFGNIKVEVGDMIISCAENPGTTISNYNVVQYNIDLTNLFWANQKVSSASSTDTTPQFARIALGTGINNSYRLTISGNSYLGGDTYTTGNITFSAPAKAGEYRGFTFNGVTDSAALYYVEPNLDDDGRLRFLIKDNANDGIEFSWILCTGDGSTESRYYFDYSGQVSQGYNKASYFNSTVATGTSPYRCTSTTVNTNLNADLLDGLHLHTGRNNEANKVVRTDRNGFIQCGYINSSNGNEGNNSSPARVWGTNGSDSYMRTYLTSALSVKYAASAGNADTLDDYHALDISQAWYTLCYGPSYDIYWYKLSSIVSTAGDNINNDWMIEIYSYNDQNYASHIHGYLRCTSYGTASTSIVLSTDPYVAYSAFNLHATIDSNRNIWLGVQAYATCKTCFRILQKSSVNAIITANWTSQTTAPNTTYITRNGALENYNGTVQKLSLNNVNVDYSTSAGTASKVADVLKLKDLTGTVKSYNGSVAVDLSEGTYMAKLPYGFNSWTSGCTWGNTTGTSFASWNDSTGGSIDFRRDNPSSGKMSIKVDGRVYVNEGTNPVLSSESNNGFWGIRTPDGGNDWIRTPDNGLIPYCAGAAGGGHSSLGTSTWYFSTAYIDNVYGKFITKDGTSSQFVKGDGSLDSTVYLPFEQSETLGSANPFATVTNYVNTPANIDSGGKLFYDIKDAEYANLVTINTRSLKDNKTAYGVILRWGYPDTYLRMARISSGTWKSTDWEKISAGYSDSTGKLSTSRKIWGQSFDGSADISGNMTGVGNINTSASPAGTIYVNNWFRSVGNCGWYSETYGGGWYMIDTSWIRNWGSKAVYLNANLCVDAKIGINTTSPQYLLDVNGKARITGPLLINGGQSNYCEGIRLTSNSNGWTTIMLKGTDNTADSGTSANSWSIHTYGGNFYINKNGSSSQQAPRLWGHSNGWSVGNTAFSSAALNVGGKAWITGSLQTLYDGTTQYTSWLNITETSNHGAKTTWKYCTASGTDGTAGTLTNAVTIDAAGAAKLTVNGTTVCYPGTYTADQTYSMSGGGYCAVKYPNIRMMGDSQGLATIEFVSSINRPSDSGFIQFQAKGAQNPQAMGGVPTFYSGESNRLVIGVTNDGDDQVWIHTPGRSGLMHTYNNSKVQIADFADWNEGMIYKNSSMQISTKRPNATAAATSTTTSVTGNKYVLAINAKSTWSTNKAVAGFDYTLVDVQKLVSEYTIVNKAMTLTSSTWTDGATISGYTTGTYIVKVTSGNTIGSGIFSLYAGTDKFNEEIPLHVSGSSNSWRPYLRISEGKLQLSTNESTGTSRTYVVKIKEML